MTANLNKADFGSIAVDPDGPISAGTIGTWCFVFTAGPQGITEGGGVRLLIPNGFSPPIILGNWPPADSEPNPNHIKEYIPCDLGFVSGHCTRQNCELEFTLADPDESFKHAVRGQNGRFLFCTLVKGHISPGDEIRIIYGDTVTGSSGASTPSTSHIIEFSCAVDTDGKRTGPEGGFWPIKSPGAKIVGATLDRWECVCSSQQVSDGTIRGVIVPRDRYDNPCINVSTELGVALDGQKQQVVPAEVSAPHQSVKVPAIPLPNNQVARIRVEDKESNLSCLSNPICNGFTQRGNIYWGDLHCHTAPDFDRVLVEEFFEFARNISLLDFCAYTPHEDFPFKLTNEDWEVAQEVTAKNNTPGELVTFVGYEFRNRGDWVVLYEQEGQPFMKGMTPVTNTVAKLLEFLAANVTSRYMLIPHLHYLPVFQDKNTGLGVLDVKDFTSEAMRNVEMYSMHGSAEFPGCPQSQSGAIETGYSPRVSDILAQVLKSGPKLGFTGSSDTHTGHPGSSKWLRNRVQYGNGLTAVCAKELTRPAIWEAIWNHRTYATTGVRMLLDFQLNDLPYGSVMTLDSKEDPRNIKIKANGTNRIQSIAVIRNGKEVYKEICDSDHVALDWQDKDALAEDSYYYLRVRQADGHMGWTSPVWVLI